MEGPLSVERLPAGTTMEELRQELTANPNKAATILFPEVRLPEVGRTWQGAGSDVLNQQSDVLQAPDA